MVKWGLSSQMCCRPQLPYVLRSQGRANASRASAVTTAALVARGLATCQHRAEPEDPSSHLLLETSEHMRCTGTAGSRLGGQRRASLAQVCLPSKPDPASHHPPSPRLAGHPGSPGRVQPSERQRRQGVITGHALHGVLPVLYAWGPWGRSFLRGLDAQHVPRGRRPRRQRPAGTRSLL